MKITVLFAQRKCDYDGQYAPEAIGVADQFTMYENPSYLMNMKSEYERTNEFESLALVTIYAPDYEIEKRLFPSREVVTGKVVELQWAKKN